MEDMAWQRITLRICLVVAMTAVVADLNVQKRQDTNDSDYVEGDAVTEVGDAAVNHDATYPGSESWMKREEKVTPAAEEEQYFDPAPRSWAPVDNPNSRELNLECSDNAFTFSLHASPITEVKVVGAASLLIDAPSSCGYSVSSYENTVTVPYTGCNVEAQNGQYTLKVSYISERGQLEEAILSCTNVVSADMLDPRAGDGQSNCADSPTGTAQNLLNPRAGSTQPPSNCARPLTGKAQNCGAPVGERVTCGSLGITKAACELRGCCVDVVWSACYYPVDECTVDRHFVFAIRPNSASIPIVTTSLVIPGKPNCVPIILNSMVAVYKFPLTECGSRSYEIGDTMIYMVEVHTMVQALNLKYGVISRTEAIRFIIECRYPKSVSSGQPLTSVGFQVKIPVLSLPSSLISHGRFGMELRLATDGTYTKYHSTTSLPLSVLLGAPVYLELNLLSPRPGSAALIVNYCLAFPRNARNALVLVYDGCKNPNDPTTSILSVRGDPHNKRQRRFMIQAFQFMDVHTNTYLDEQIYFMCSTYVCVAEPCAEGCFAEVSP